MKKEKTKRFYVENDVMARKQMEARKQAKEKYLDKTHIIDKDELDDEEFLKYLIDIFDEENDLKEMILLGKKSGVRRIIFKD